MLKKIMIVRYSGNLTTFSWLFFIAIIFVANTAGHLLGSALILPYLAIALSKLKRSAMNRPRGFVGNNISAR